MAVPTIDNVSQNETAIAPSFQGASPVGASIERIGDQTERLGGEIRRIADDAQESRLLASRKRIVVEVSEWLQAQRDAVRRARRVLLGALPGAAACPPAEAMLD